MAGGGGKQKPQPYTPAPRQEIEPVQQAQFPTSGFQGIGYTQVPQTYTQEAMPSWMQGGQMDLGAQGFQGMPGASKGMPNYFQMPQWGTDAATGEPLTQEGMQPQAAPPPPAPAPAPAPVPGQNPNQDLMDQINRGITAQQLDRRFEQERARNNLDYRFNPRTGRAQYMWESQ